MFAYCGNNPMCYFDSHGTMMCSCFFPDVGWIPATNNGSSGGGGQSGLVRPPIAYDKDRVEKTDEILIELADDMADDWLGLSWKEKGDTAVLFLGIAEYLCQERINSAATAVPFVGKVVTVIDGCAIAWEIIRWAGIV